MNKTTQHKDAYILWLSIFFVILITYLNQSNTNIFSVISILLSLFCADQSISRRFSKRFSKIVIIIIISFGLYIRYIDKNHTDITINFGELIIKDVKQTNNTWKIFAQICNENKINNIWIRTREINNLQSDYKTFIKVKESSSKIKKIDRVLISNEKKHIFQKINEHWIFKREIIKTIIKKKVSSIINNKKTESFLLSAIFGFKFNDKTSKNFLKAGIAHILVVSGFHFHCIFKISSFISQFINRKLQPIFILSILSLYFFIIGPTYPAIRSFICSCNKILISVLSRPYNSAQSIGIAMLIQTVIYHDCLKSISFLLTYVSSISLITVANFFVRFTNKHKNIFKHNIINSYYSFIINGFISSLSVQIAIAPIELMSWGYISPIALLGNIFLTPIVPFIIYTSILSFISGFLFTKIGVIFMQLPNLLTIILLSLTEKISNRSFEIAIGIDKNYCEFLPFIFILLYGIMILKNKPSSTDI